MEELPAMDKPPEQEFKLPGKESAAPPQSVDEAGPSNSDVNNRTKHDIFISHSGKQKDFAELLYQELKNCGYNPFFDKDRYSLPVGKEFSKRIFDAARQCRIAIFILSEDFFNNSKWPMLELAAVVESKEEKMKKENCGMEYREVDLIPVLYKDFTKETIQKNRQDWLKMWRNFKSHSKKKKNRPKINIGNWEHALDELLESGWVSYDWTTREYGLIKNIVNDVRRLLPSPNPLSDGNVQGIQRIRQAVLDLIDTKTKLSSDGVCIVGIYGMGGIGKTTLCKDLCDYKSTKFEGKVCHAELGSLSSRELQEEVLRKLTNINEESLKVSTDAQIGDLLKKRIHQQKVFLTLDNVWEESIKEANAYLDVAFSPNSVVMVTARSIDILLKLYKIDRSACMEMPELEEEDARQLFLHHAAPHFQSKTEDDGKNIRFCIYLCHFSKGENMKKHFHPLALKVLGGQLRSLECDPSMWVKSLSENKFNQFQEKEHPAFHILRRGYDLLTDEDQLLFMDVVLFNPCWKCDARYLSSNDGANLFEWLRIIYNSSLRLIKKRLEGLKAKSLLEDIGDGIRNVSVHDLYVEFAEMEANRGTLNARRWVWTSGISRTIATPMDLWKMPSGNCWPNVERIIAIYNSWSWYDRDMKGIYDEDWFDGWIGTVKRIKWQHFANVVVLELEICNYENLDLHGLQCLKSLKLTIFEGTITGLGELWNLGWLELYGIHHAPCIEEIGRLTKLEVLHLRTYCSDIGKCFLNRFDSVYSQPLELLDFDKCIRLRELLVACRCLKEFPDLRMMASLRMVHFEECYIARGVLRLGPNMSMLEELRLSRCNSFHRLDGLGDVDSLTSLKRLVISSALQLSCLPDFHNLVALEKLQLKKLPMVKELPSMHSLMKLRRIIIEDVPLRLCPSQLLILLPLRNPVPKWECVGKDKDNMYLSQGSHGGQNQDLDDELWYKVTHFRWGDDLKLTLDEMFG